MPEGGFEHPQREEPVRPCVLQKSLKLGDGPDLAALFAARGEGGAVADDVPLGPSPDREVPPRPGEACDGWLTTVLGSSPGDSFRCAASVASSAARRPSFPGLDRLAYQRVILLVLAMAPKTCHSCTALQGISGPSLASRRTWTACALDGLPGLGLDPPPRRGAWHRGASQTAPSISRTSRDPI